MSTTPRGYLCGGINNLSDAECKDWRAECEHRIGLSGAMPLYELVDPMRRDYRGREGEPGIAEEIVRGDLIDIDSSQLLIVNASKPSWGTAMEIMYAYQLRPTSRAIVAFGAGEFPSPWLAHHTTLVPTIDDAIGFAVEAWHALFARISERVAATEAEREAANLHPDDPGHRDISGVLHRSDYRDGG